MNNLPTEYNLTPRHIAASQRVDDVSAGSLGPAKLAVKNLIGPLESVLPTQPVLKVAGLSHRLICIASSLHIMDVTCGERINIEGQK